MPWTFDDDTAARLVGASASVDLTVTQADTAARHRSGDLDVLATPRIVALVEEAATVALADALPPHVTSVGTSVDIRHRAPSAVGARIRATATITGIDGTRVQFEVSASEDPDGSALLIAEGTHARALVDRGSFEVALAERSNANGSVRGSA